MPAAREKPSHLRTHAPRASAHIAESNGALSESKDSLTNRVCRSHNNLVSPHTSLKPLSTMIANRVKSLKTKLV